MPLKITRISQIINFEDSYFEIKQEEYSSEETLYELFFFLVVIA